MHHVPVITGPADNSIPGRRASLKRIRTSVKTLLAVVLGVSSLCAVSSAQTAGTYQATNIISDGSVAATTTDASFINPWGVAVGPAFWINTQVTGLDYVATAAGQIAFKVNIPAASGTGTGVPSGTVFNSSANLFALSNGAAASFLFATVDGTISGWNGALGTTNPTALIAINNGASNAVYTDMALLTNPTGTFILAANFGAGNDIEVYNSTFAPAKLTGNFTDPNLPASYSPFSVHVIGSQVFVAYALRTVSTSTTGTTSSTGTTGSGPIGYDIKSNSSAHAAADTYVQTVGAGNGILDVFDLNGNFVARAITGGNLNAPWGVAVAPTGFGVFGGDLLVGNFGDGMINAYNPTTFAYAGQLADTTGKSLSYPSLWEIAFGLSNATPALAGDPNTLYIASGLTNEAHGLFAGIANTTTATGAATFGFSASTSATTAAADGTAMATVSAAPTNSFSGTVALACSGPTGVTCTFSPSSLSVTPTAPATSTVTIQTASGTAHLESHSPRTSHGPWTKGASIIAAAFLMPFSSILIFFRRRATGKGNPLRLLGIIVLLLAATGVVIGCSGSSSSSGSMSGTPTPTPSPVAPAGAQMVTITATSGSITQTTTIAVTVQ